MRVGFTASTLAHAALVAWGLVSLPAASPLAVDAAEPVPVEIVSGDEISKTMRGLEDAPKRETPSAVRPEEARLEPKDAVNPGAAKEDDSTPPTPEPKKAPTPPSAAPAPPPPPPEPKPVDMAKADPVPEPPDQAEPAPAPAPKPTAEPRPSPEPAPKQSESVAAPPRPVPAPPRPRPPRPAKAAEAKPEPARKPTPPAPESPEREFDPDKIAALINRAKPSGGGARTDEAPPALGSTSGRDAVLSQDERDALARRLYGCWSIPAGAPGLDGLVATIEFPLNPDGTLAAYPQVVNPSGSAGFRVLAESAVRAVLRCEQEGAFTILPREKYERWRHIIFNFDPRQMLGG